MIPKIILHIGATKTGSSTLQNFLYTNRGALSKHNILYPVFSAGRNHTSIVNLRKMNSHAPSKAFKSLFDLINNDSGYETAIISSETLSNFNTEQIQFLRKQFNTDSIKIIYYVRRQDLRIESLFNQRSKYIFKRPTGNFTVFKNDVLDKNNYNLILKPWRDAFGKDSINVKVFESTQIPNHCLDMLDTLGINNHSDFTTIESKNVKIGLKSLLIMKAFQNIFFQLLPESIHYLKQKTVNNYISEYRRIRYKRIKYKLKKRVLDYTSTNWDEINNYRLLPYKDCLDMIEYFRPSNQIVAEEYLDRDKLFYESPLPYEHIELDMKIITKTEWKGFEAFFLRDRVIHNILTKLFKSDNKIDKHFKSDLFTMLKNMLF